MKRYVFDRAVIMRVIGLFTTLVVLFSTISPVKAGDIIKVPLKWCAMDGSPAVTNPELAPKNFYTNMPEKSTNDVLWRRHERASEFIWIKQANISFRSGVTREIKDNAKFPIIADPCPPTDVKLCQGGDRKGFSCDSDSDCGGHSCATQSCPSECIDPGENPQSLCEGKLGDVVYGSSFYSEEENLASKACRNAWDALLKERNVECRDVDTLEVVQSAFPCDNPDNYQKYCVQTAEVQAKCLGATPLIGPTVVNIREYLRTSSVGVASGALVKAKKGEPSVDVCKDPPSPAITETQGGLVFITDNQLLAGTGQFEEEVLAHELGHVLRLEHGNGLDDDGNGLFDEDCDDGEDPNAAPASLMTTPSTSTVITDLQARRAQAVASGYPGNDDPPGTDVPRPAVGDEVHDASGDVTDRGIDIDRVVVTKHPPTQSNTFWHVLGGLVPFEAARREYLVFADLDGDAATGGAPASLGFPTAFQGAELVTSVVARLDSLGESRVLEATVWRFQAGAFVEVLDPEIRPALLEPPVEDRSPQFHVVAIGFPDAVRGPANKHVRIEAIARQLDGLELDRLPDVSAEDGGGYLSVVAPQFPACAVTPAVVQPGSVATVEASGLFENATVHVFLGDREVVQGVTDADGNTSLDFALPVVTEEGSHLVTVGVADTALTADCFVDVEGVLPIILTPEISRNDEGQDHTVTATIRDASGNPLPGVQVSFNVASGPNTGAQGICSFNADCITDALGMVSFTYTGDGGSGVDQISASFSGAQGMLTSNTALKFWDVDCNQNNIADTCDIACSGFGGLCGEVIGCGLSGDENGDGVPDECNLSPDCSVAGAEPDELWPPSHDFKDITIAGVTDPDGDPVTSVITSIFQDEAVDARGSGNTSPDGTGVGTPTARVRSERTGRGDGRVYHIGFDADDGQGGQCSGEVTVCVPHDQRPGHFCGDQGPMYDSTVEASDKSRRRKNR